MNRIISSLLVSLITITGIESCHWGHRYSPIISSTSVDSKVNNNALEVLHENVLIKINGLVSFPSLSSMIPNFDIIIVNYTADTVVIRYESIGAYYTDKQITKEVFRKHKIIDTGREPEWKIPPYSEEIRSVIFEVKPVDEFLDRHHVLTIFINEIKKVPSGITFKFKGDFKV